MYILEEGFGSNDRQLVWEVDVLRFAEVHGLKRERDEVVSGCISIVLLNNVYINMDVVVEIG